jgi:hypothetical protein
MTPRQARQRAQQVASAVSFFESHRDFPSVQVEIHDRTNELALSVTRDAQTPGTDARMNHLVTLFDVMAAAYLRLVSSLEAQKAYAVILAQLMRQTWEQYTGHPFDLLPPYNAERVAPIQARVRHWTNEGFRRIASNRLDAQPVFARDPEVTTPHRFLVALSFPGEHRRKVESIAQLLAAKLTRERVLYDAWHREEFARPNLDVYLPKLYHEQSFLLVFFLCGEFVQRQWCGLEWRAGRDLLKRGQDERLMFLRLDGADVPGLYSIDGFVDINGMPESDVANAILKRLDMATPIPGKAS